MVAFIITTPSCMSDLTDCMGRRESALVVRHFNTRADYNLFLSLQTVADCSWFFRLSVFAFMLLFQCSTSLWYLFASFNNYLFAITVLCPL